MVFFFLSFVPSLTFVILCTNLLAVLYPSFNKTGSFYYCDLREDITLPRTSEEDIVVRMREYNQCIVRCEAIGYRVSLTNA